MSRITLGSNINSLRIQRELSNTTSRLSTVYERLSSGQRINRASDDAAGLSISETLGTNARVFSQGVRNLNDGISLINIADGALSQLTDITIRLKELAEQGANGIFGPQQRKSIDAEAQSLSREYTRIVRSTKFNGRLLFDDEFGKLTLQAGFGTDGGVTSGLGGSVGNGTFQTPISAALASSGSGVAADFNGDGNDDAAFGSNAGAAYIMMSNGDGTFKALTGYATTGAPIYMEANDVNGDGIVDIIASNGATSSILLGNGNGTFRTGVVSSTGRIVESRDVNGDGAIDLIGVVGSSLAITIGNGDGTFKARTLYSNSSSVYEVAMEDFNGDGILDVAFTQSASTALRVMVGNGDGTFRNVQNFSLATGILGNGLKAGDFDGDGQFDLIYTEYAGSRVGVLLGNGDGTFRASQAAQVAGGGASAIETGDFNGDGMLDVLAIDYADGNLNLLYGAGNGTFSTITSVNISTDFGSIALGDFNNDGVYDIAGTDSSINRVYGVLGTSVDGVAPLKQFSLKNMLESRAALTEFDKVLRRLTLQRGTLGAFSSRLQTALAVTSDNVENYTIARSRIMDADIASETSELARSQILQQSAQAVLAQANQQPAIALALLRI